MTMRQTDHRAASETVYDAVIAGSGVSGAVTARALAERGLSVLVVEAGPGHELSISEYESYVERFYGAVQKDTSAPYPVNPNAPTPRSADMHAPDEEAAGDDGYFVQNGPLPTDSTYTRVLGGTTMHWEGKALRMLPEDFETATRFGVGRDWPISYGALESSYRRAEFELGVSANVEDQEYHGISFAEGYVYPMQRMPLSYLDGLIARDLDGMGVHLDGQRHELRVRSTPQARNGVPNADYDNGRGYTPVGAVSTHQVEEGNRCQGNINCVPICPVQAKYNARKTLQAALETGRVDILSQTVISGVNVDAEGQVTGLDYKAYGAPTSPEHTSGTLLGRVYMLAANPVENARLMLASGLPGSNGLVGRNLMDHAYLLNWALMPEIAGALRGTQCTAGFEDVRGGTFRREHAAMRMSIHNDGWGWATGSPYSDLGELVEDENLFGTGLRDALVDRVSRQLLLDCMVELLPDHENRVTVDPRFTDAIGNPRPVLSYRMSQYTLDGIAVARQVARRMFQRLGAADHTRFDPQDPAYVEHEGEGYVIRGGNHWAGTHIMGSSSSDSVVDEFQRSWEHPNLFLIGAGSMPTIGTANTTLTLSALCLRTAEHVADTLAAHPTSTTGVTQR